MTHGFQEVARAIARIREARLYKQAGYSTFEAYCEERLGMSRRRGDYLASAHFTIKSLPENLRKFVRSQAETQAISRIPEENRGAVLKQVAASGPVTVKAIRAVAAGKVIDVEPEREAQQTRHCPTCTCLMTSINS
jgi:plasmid stability protein